MQIRSLARGVIPVNSIFGLLKRAKIWFFDCVYNPVYDLTTARLSYYQRLQEECISKLGFESDSMVLCVGVGTGNEVLRILKRKENVNVVGVDISDTALRRVYKKTLALGKEIKVLRMDAQGLGFSDETFDRVICIHLMDFLDNMGEASQEISRVLRRGGQFVITYPSGDVGFRMAGEIVQNMCRNLRSRRLEEVIKESLAVLGAMIVYSPMILLKAPGQDLYSRESLETMFASLGFKNYNVEEDGVYQDIIAYGVK